MIDCGGFRGNEEGKSDALWSESETPSKNEELACFSQTHSLFCYPVSPATRESLPQNLDGSDHGTGGIIFDPDRDENLFPEDGQSTDLFSQLGDRQRVSRDLSVAHTGVEHGTVPQTQNVGTACNGRLSPLHGAPFSTLHAETQMPGEQTPQDQTLSASKALRARNRKTISRYEPGDELKPPVESATRPVESAKRGRLSLKKAERNPDDIVWIIDVCEVRLRVVTVRCPVLILAMPRTGLAGGRRFPPVGARKPDSSHEWRVQSQRVVQQLGKWARISGLGCGL